MTETVNDKVIPPTHPGLPDGKPISPATVGFGGDSSRLHPGGEMARRGRAQIDAQIAALKAGRYTPSVQLRIDALVESRKAYE